jgi:hypothetical protein
MTQADDELRRAMRRVEPPAGFTERVIARAASGGFRQPSMVGDPARSVSGGRMARWATAAVLVVSAAAGLWYLGELRREAEGEKAKRQVLLSLRIASDELQRVQTRVNAVGHAER